jgi:L-threonate 2-dehydrogenase
MPQFAPTKPSTIAILGLGGMGAGVAADLKRSKFTVVSTLEGRSAKTRQRAEEAGVRVLANLGEVIAAADTFLSITPADQAEPLAIAVAERLKGKAIHYVDCNSITPSKTERIARMVEAAGATYSDGGIIGPPPAEKSRTCLYVSGPHAGVLTTMASERMPVLQLGERITEATEMKVLFSAANKGVTALLANVLAGAQKVGLLDKVMAEMDARRPGLLTAVRGSAGELGDKALRWAIEMDDLAEALSDLGAHGGYHKAAGEGYRRLAANLEGAPAGGDAVARVLEAWIGEKKG